MYSDYEVGVRQEDRERIARTNEAKESGPKPLLRKTLVGSLFPEGRTRIVTIPSTSSVADAFKILIDHKILAAPVLDEAKKKYFGFIGLNDIVTMFVREFNNTELEAHREDIGALLQTKKDLHSMKSLEIIDISSRNPYCPVDENAPLQAAIDLIVKWAVHRLPVVDPETGNLVTVLTQSHVVSFLQKHIAQFPFHQRTVAELRLGYKDVIAVHENDTAAQAFRLISDKRVQGIAVLDANDRLIGNISASDLKVIGHTAKLLPLLLVPLKEFSSFIAPNETIPGPVTVNPSNTIEEVFFKITVAKVHRAYVVNEQQKLLGVISLLDLLELFHSDK